MITWMLTAISLAGNVLNCMKFRLCFIVWIVCNVGWTIYDASTGLYSRLTLDVVQTILCVFGYVSWGKYEKKKEYAVIYHKLP